jgi:endonuclease G
MARRSNQPDGFDVRPLVNAFQRLDRRTQMILVVVAVAIGVVGLAAYYVSQREHAKQQQTQTQGQAAPPGTTAPAAPDPADNLLLGNPSGATADPANRDNYLLIKKFFTLSYNDTKGTPNWVSWRVTAADLGTAARKPQFDPDNELPAGFKRITHRDYTGGGFDRGHMCPHSDRAGDREKSYATFVMTNVIPQAANVNQKAWRELEEYGRELVYKQHRRLYVVSGPAGRGGRGLNGTVETIAKGKVVVPAECWKVIVSVPETDGPGDPSAVTADTRVIAVDMPNDNAVVTGSAWAQYRVSPAEVERRTGYRFFDRLRPDVAEALRQKVDAVHIPPPQTRGRGED